MNNISDECTMLFKNITVTTDGIIYIVYSSSSSSSIVYGLA